MRPFSASLSEESSIEYLEFLRQISSKTIFLLYLMKSIPVYLRLVDFLIL